MIIMKIGLGNKPVKHCTEKKDDKTIDRLIDLWR